MNKKTRWLLVIISIYQLLFSLVILTTKETLFQMLLLFMNSALMLLLGYYFGSSDIDINDIIEELKLDKPPEVL